MPCPSDDATGVPPPKTCDVPIDDGEESDFRRPSA
jgi:hypothetical protein